MFVIPVLALNVGGLSTASAAEVSKTIEYNCLGSALGLIDVDIDMDVTVSATVPEAVEPGEEFTIENSYTTISMGVTDILRTTANPLNGQVSQFNLELDNATETDSGNGVVNVAEEPLPFGPIDFEDDDETVQFRVPETGGIDVNLTAGDSGDIKLTAGEIVTTVTASALGMEVDVDVTCNPLDGQDRVLNTIQIGSGDGGEDPGNGDGGNGKDPGDGDNGEDPGDGNNDEDPGAGNGQDGKDGEDGKDGVDGKDGQDGKDGKDGKDGQDGKDGKDCDCEENGTSGTNDNDKKGDGTKGSGTGGKLPNTATTHPLTMMIGSLMAIAGGAFAFIRRKALN